MHLFSNIDFALFKPVIWGVLAASAAVGLVGIISPRTFARLNAWSSRCVDTEKFLKVFDTHLEVDRRILPHSRLFGLAVIAASLILALMLGVHG